jgi:hypothetical protein
MLGSMVEAPQDVEDLRRLISLVEEIAAADVRKAATCGDLLSKLRVQLRAHDTRRRPAA